jgi:hypothetical protein
MRYCRQAIQESFGEINWCCKRDLEAALRTYNDQADSFHLSLHTFYVLGQDVKHKGQIINISFHCSASSSFSMQCTLSKQDGWFG